jgi:hypothetical protein
VEEIEGKEVGFLTFPFPPDSAVADAMEKKVKMLLRAQIGSPPAITQVLALRQQRIVDATRRREDRVSPLVHRQDAADHLKIEASLGLGAAT